MASPTGESRRRTTSSPVAVAARETWERSAGCPGPARAGQAGNRLPDAGKARRQPVAKRRRPGQRPEPEREPLDPRSDPLVDEIAAKVEQQFGQRDLHRAGIG